MIYIDFDGVILDTEDVMFEEWHKKPNIHLLTEEDKIRYLQELDWDYLISISEPINNSIEFLKLCQKMDKKLWIRAVIIPGINDTKEYINELITVIKPLKNVNLHKTANVLSKRSSQ